MLAGNVEHIINRRFYFGYAMLEEHGWSSENAALYDAKLLLDVFARNG